MKLRSFGAGLVSLVVSVSASAAVPTDFALFKDNPSIVQSVTVLSKGDVVEVHAFKADSGSVVILGMCDEKCEHVHVVKSIAASRSPANNVTERYTLEENGHLVFWMVQPPRADLHAAGGDANPGGANEQIAEIHSESSGVSGNAQIMPIRKSEISADQIKVRFDKGSYMTLSRVSAATP
jgi:hypothetical protein